MLLSRICCSQTLSVVVADHSESAPPLSEVCLTITAYSEKSMSLFGGCGCVAMLHELADTSTLKTGRRSRMHVKMRRWGFMQLSLVGLIAVGRPKNSRKKTVPSSIGNNAEHVPTYQKKR